MAGARTLNAEKPLQCGFSCAVRNCDVATIGATIFGKNELTMTG